MQMLLKPVTFAVLVLVAGMMLILLPDLSTAIQMMAAAAPPMPHMPQTPPCNEKRFLMVFLFAMKRRKEKQLPDGVLCAVLHTDGFLPDGTRDGTYDLPADAISLVTDLAWKDWRASPLLALFWWAGHTLGHLMSWTAAGHLRTLEDAALNPSLPAVLGPFEFPRYAIRIVALEQGQPFLFEVRSVPQAQTPLPLGNLIVQIGLNSCAENLEVRARIIEDWETLQRATGGSERAGQILTAVLLRGYTTSIPPFHQQYAYQAWGAAYQAWDALRQDDLRAWGECGPKLVQIPPRQ